MTDLKCDFYTEAKQSEKYKNNRGCLRSRNPLTAKGPKRIEIAQWAILAKGPDCRGGITYRYEIHCFNFAYFAPALRTLRLKKTFKKTSVGNSLDY
jgi:hypothetical protein